MNKERILELANFIEMEVPPHKFDMDTYGVSACEIDNKDNINIKLGNCGTMGCLAGWTMVKFKKIIPDFVDESIAEFEHNDNLMSIQVILAGKILGLSIREAGDLFHPYLWTEKEEWSDITKEEAVDHLRSLANE